MRSSALFTLCWSCYLLLLPEVAADEAPAAKADRRFLELTVGPHKHQGRQLISDSQFCWLLERDGRMRNIDLGQVTEFKKVGNVFRPFTPNEMRPKLLTEFGKKYEVDARAHQVVVAPAGKAKACGEVVEVTSKSFTAYFNRRNFKLDPLELPLVTIVFPSSVEFLAYCEQEGLKQTKGLRGYYSPTTNRVALFLDSKPTGTRATFQDFQSPLSDVSRPSGDAPGAAIGRLTAYGAAVKEGGFQDTLVHETTHQMGFNSGLHSRLGDDPTWVVEGLAMLFEGDANRDDARQQSTVSQRMNRERYMWFQEYQKARRPARALEEFLTTDVLFQAQTLDAYSEAWALMFFLAETRSTNLSGYLKKLANRNELGEYSPMKRLNDFKASFGKDIPQLETQYLRFMKQLELKTPDPGTQVTDLTKP